MAGAGTASAQTSDAALARVRARLQPGDRITVIDDGSATTGRFVEAARGTIRLRTAPGIVEVPIQEVEEVRKRGDSPWNGLLIGAALGAAIGFGTYDPCEPEPPETVCGGNLSSNRAMETAVMAATFGAVGLAVDVFLDRSTTIYRARAPRRRAVGLSVSRRRAAALVAVRF